MNTSLLKCTVVAALALSLAPASQAAPGRDSEGGQKASKAERQARRQARQQQAPAGAPAQPHGEGPATSEIPYTPAAFDSMQVLTGNVIEGDLEDLRESDDEVMRLESGFGRHFANLHLLEMQFVARTNVPMPILLALTLDSRCTEHGQVTFRLRNFETGLFETVASTATGPTSQRFYLGDIAAARYINEEGEMHLSVQQVVHVPVVSHIFETQIDWLEIGVY